jgi:hypothetical protein
MVVGRIGPKHIEAIPARVGLEFNCPGALDPAASRHGVMQQMGSVHEIDFADAVQRPLFAV